MRNVETECRIGGLVFSRERTHVVLREVHDPSRYVVIERADLEQLMELLAAAEAVAEVCREDARVA